MRTRENTGPRANSVSSALMGVALLLVLAAFLFVLRGIAYADNARSGDYDSTSVDGAVASAESGLLTPASVDYTGGSGLIPDNTPALSIHEPDQQDPYGLTAQDAPPSVYDSREHGHVSGVRNQGLFGTCWAFATIASMESSLLVKGEEDLSDLSERHLAYFTYHSQPDALGNTQGDYTTPVGSSFGLEMSDRYLVAGGNAIIASHVVETGQGVVLEQVASYDAMLNEYYLFTPNKFLEKTALAPELAYQSSATIENTRFIAMSDRDDVKRAVMEYGAAIVEVKAPGGSKDPYYNESECAYYMGDMSEDDTSDHMVTIVGWDDDYSLEKFNASSSQPSHDGAWLIKNSWGEDEGNGGYYWLSYKDRVINRETSKAYVFDSVPADANPKNIYQYDGSGAMTYNTVESGGSIANVFRATANPEGHEQLDSVAISLTDVNVSYSIQVYTHVESSADPTDGAPMLAEPLTGKTSYAGYYTIPLPSPVQLPKDGLYSVVVTLSHDSPSPVKYDVDATYGAYGRYSENTDWVHFTNAVTYGQSFERDKAGARWDDLASTSCDSGDEPESSARLKAFTSNQAAPDVPPVSLEDADVSLDTTGATYDGTPREPLPTVRHDGRVLEKGVDYCVKYRNNVNAGTATVVVYGMNRYEGSATASFTVSPASLAKAVISGVKGKTFTGKQLQQSATVRFGNTTLVQGRDYTLSYKNNVKAGTASVVFTGMGNFAGSVSRQFAIARAANPVKASAKKVKVSLAKVKKRSVAIAAKKVVAVSKAQGKVSYKKVSGNKKIVVNKKTGKVTVKKGLKRGTYKLKVKVTAAGNANYLSKAVTATAKIVVK